MGFNMCYMFDPFICETFTTGTSRCNIVIVNTHWVNEEKYRHRVKVSV